MAIVSVIGSFGCLATWNWRSGRSGRSGGSRRSGGNVYWYLEDFCWSWGGADHGDWWWWWWCWPLWLGHWFAPSFDTTEASKGTGSFMLSLSNMSSRSLESSKMPRRPSLPSSSVYFHPRCSLHSSCASMQTLSSSVISLLLFRGRERASVFREVEYPGGSTCFNYQLGEEIWRFEAHLASICQNLWQLVMFCHPWCPGTSSRRWRRAMSSPRRSENLRPVSRLGERARRHTGQVELHKLLSEIVAM